MGVTNPQRIVWSCESLRFEIVLKIAESPAMKSQNRTDTTSFSPTSINSGTHDTAATRLQQIVQHTSPAIMGSACPPRDSSKLFSPLRLGTMNLEHRVIMSPLTRLRCPGSVPTPVVTEYYTQRATKGGLLITEGMHPSLMVRQSRHPERVIQLGNIVVW